MKRRTIQHYECIRKTGTGSSGVVFIATAATLIFLLTTAITARPQEPQPGRPYSPTRLPGRNLAQYDLLVFGEFDPHRMEQTISIVRAGRVVWTYSIPRVDHGEGQEIGDAHLLPNGNILFARQHGASIVTPQKKIVWSYDAPADADQTTYFPRNAEIHAVEPAPAFGPDRIMLVINQTPESRLLILNTRTNAVEKTILLPTPKSGVHLHFRRVHLTPAGTILAAHLDEARVVEYDMSGRELWSYEISKPWAVARLANGNTLISGAGIDGAYAREVNPAHQTVWEFTQADTPFGLFHLDEAVRLPNGNTLIANWCSHIPQQDFPGTVQELEVTPEKKVAWALRSWDAPNDLGTVSGVTILNSKQLKFFPK